MMKTKDVAVLVRMTTAERKAIEAAAKKLDLPLATYVRTIALAAARGEVMKTPTPEEIAAVMTIATMPLKSGMERISKKLDEIVRK